MLLHGGGDGGGGGDAGAATTTSAANTRHRTAAKLGGARRRIAPRWSGERALGATGLGDARCEDRRGSAAPRSLPAGKPSRIHLPRWRRNGGGVQRGAARRSWENRRSVLFVSGPPRCEARPSWKGSAVYVRQPVPIRRRYRAEIRDKRGHEQVGRARCVNVGAGERRHSTLFCHIRPSPSPPAVVCCFSNCYIPSPSPSPHRCVISWVNCGGSCFVNQLHSRDSAAFANGFGSQHRGLAAGHAHRAAVSKRPLSSIQRRQWTKGARRRVPQHTARLPEDDRPQRQGGGAHLFWSRAAASTLTHFRAQPNMLVAVAPNAPQPITATAAALSQCVGGAARRGVGSVLVCDRTSPPAPRPAARFARAALTRPRLRAGARLARGRT